jgi:hypothetical protein
VRAHDREVCTFAPEFTVRDEFIRGEELKQSCEVHAVGGGPGQR